jgi:hypothetical protein
MFLMCTQFVYVVKCYIIGDLYMIKLDLFYIWRVYRQIWIYGTNKDMKMNKKKVPGPLKQLSVKFEEHSYVTPNYSLPFS